MINKVQECGLYEIDMNGMKGLSWQEIKSWQDATGNKDQWMAIKIKQLSASYVTEYRLSEDASRPSPFDDLEKQRATVSQQLKNFIKAEKND